MKLTAEDILNRVNRLEDKRADYKKLAAGWERMWRLDPGFGRSLQDALDAGQEQVVLPTPYNVINVAERLLASWPDIQYKCQDVGNREAEQNAEDVEKWLLAYWRQAGHAQMRNVLVDARKYMLLRGRVAIEVKWIEDALPEKLRKRRNPIHTRALDPVNVGVKDGPFGAEWVYHRYESNIADVIHRWPKLKKSGDGGRWGTAYERYLDNEIEEEDAPICVIDFWYVDPKDGSIWNAVLVEDEFGKPPFRTDYPELPIVVGRGDYAPGLGDEFDGLGLLHPLSGLWEAQCRLASLMMTGLLWHFWPSITVSNDQGHPVDDIMVGPGQIKAVEPGTRFDMLKIEPNVPMAQTVYGQLDAAVQQSGFPEVMYGKAPGDLQAGYGVSLLSDAAEGRIDGFLEGLELVFARVNAIILSLVEEFSGETGVSIWGVDERDSQKYVLTLKGSMIDGNYDNEVSFAPQIPQDMMQKQTLGIRLADSHHISSQTLRDKFLPGITLPTDETKRIMIEEFMTSEEMKPWRMRKAAQVYEPEKWLTLLASTPWMPTPPQGFHWMPDGSLMPDSAMGAGPAGAGMGGPPLSPGNGPMMPPSGMPGMPPGGPGAMGGPPTGMPTPPPGMPPPGLQPPQILGGPMGGSPIPGQMQGQIMPGDLGLPPQGNEEIMATMLNRPMSPEEELQMMQGLPPQLR